MVDIRRVIAAGLLLVPAAGWAKDTKPCGTGMICASAPDTIVAAMQEAGYKAKLTTDDDGDPSIESATSGYNFDVFFYGCEAHKNCDSVQFRVTFKADPANTAALANGWNSSKRFMQAAVDTKARLKFNYDVSTIGGLNQANFADVLSWLDYEVGEIGKFLAAPPPATTAVAK